MKFFCAASGVVLFLTGTHLLVAAPEGGGTAVSLATAEKAFAAESVEKGMKTAFLNALADDAVVFDPGPGAQNGKQVWLAKKDSEAILDWQPDLAVVSSSGDLGYTAGPWTFRQSSKAKANAFGEFVSVWRRVNGTWKLICDIGSEHAEPSSAPPELKLIDLPHANESKPESLADLQVEDRKYSAKRPTAFANVADDNVRLYLTNKFPLLGKSEASQALSEDSDSIKFGDTKGGISASGDLGYLWGEYRLGSAAHVTGDYLRIWRKDEKGGWKLVLELFHPR